MALREKVMVTSSSRISSVSERAVRNEQLEISDASILNHEKDGQVVRVQRWSQRWMDGWSESERERKGGRMNSWIKK